MFPHLSLNPGVAHFTSCRGRFRPQSRRCPRWGPRNLPLRGMTSCVSFPWPVGKAFESLFELMAGLGEWTTTIQNFGCIWHRRLPSDAAETSMSFNRLLQRPSPGGKGPEDKLGSPGVSVIPWREGAAFPCGYLFATRPCFLLPCVCSVYLFLIGGQSRPVLLCLQGNLWLRNLLPEAQPAQEPQTEH